eukprot:g6213.t1
MKSYQNSAVEYNNACDRIKVMLKDYSVLITKIKRISKSMASGKDVTKYEMSKMHRASQEANALANDINKRMAKFGAFYRSSKLQLTLKEKEARRRKHQQLLKESERQQSSFEQVIRDALRAEKKMSARVANTDDEEDDIENSGQRSRLIQKQDLENEIAFTESLIEERSKGIDNIHKQLTDVGQAFQDLHHIIHDQRSDIENIEHNIDSALNNAEGGLNHVRKADEYQISRRKTMFCTLLCLLSFAVALFIYFTVASKIKK